MNPNSNGIGDNLIRSGLAWSQTSGFLLVCDPEREEEEAHANLVLVNDGDFADLWLGFNAHTICAIDVPEQAVLVASDDGFYAMNSDRVLTGNIFEDLQTESGKKRFGSVRSLNSVDGTAFVVGLRGLVARFDRNLAWVKAGSNLPESFDAHALDGFGSNDLYAVGSGGQIWHFDGRKWNMLETPTNTVLTAVKCAPDGYVYVVGHSGIIMIGNKEQWSIVDQETVVDDLWGIEWFDGSIYVSTFSNVFRLEQDQIVEVKFGFDRVCACYHLSSVDEVMWSIGERDVVVFDGTVWNRLV